MSWRIAESLKKLREQINAEYPGRDKASDGGIGDERHASQSSDHNPWVKDARGQGVVTAIDIDEDLAGNIHSVQFVVDAIIASRDRRVKYIIYEGKMCSSYPARGYAAWQWRKYTGTKNPHNHHAHISVNPAPVDYDNRAEWSVGFKRDAVKQLRDDLVSEGFIEKVVEPPAVIPPEKTDSIEAAEIPQDAHQDQAQPLNSEPAGFTPEKFNAFVPQIDTAKAWIKRATAGTVLGSVLAYVGNLPQWLQIGLFSLLLIIVVGGIVMLVKYHSEIFAYVTKMNTLRATEGANDPVIVGKPPTD